MIVSIRVITLMILFFFCFRFIGQNKREAILNQADVQMVEFNPSPVVVNVATIQPEPGCREYSDTLFIPTIFSDTIYYRVNFHFFKRKNGPGPYDSVTERDAHILVDDFNHRFSGIQPPTLKHPGNPTWIKDSKIRLKYSGFYVHTSDSAFMSGMYWSLDIYNKYKIHADSVINVFFISEEALGNGGHGTYSLPCYIYMNVTNPRYYFWAFLDLFVHEMGHTAGGLQHTDIPAAGDYVVENSRDASKWGWIPCKEDTVGNNILGYNRCRNYLSPLQMARWRKEGTYGDRVRFTNYCTYSAEPLIISYTQAWGNHRVINRDIIIKKGSTLIVKCKLIMAPGAKIIIEPGAKLFLEGGSVTTKCGSPWKGIEVWGNSKKPKGVSTLTGLSEFQGVLELSETALISNANVAISIGKRNSKGKFVKNSGGGVLIYKASNFRDNKKDIDGLESEKK